MASLQLPVLDLTVSDTTLPAGFPDPDDCGAPYIGKRATEKQFTHVQNVTDSHLLVTEKVLEELYFVTEGPTRII